MVAEERGAAPAAWVDTLKFSGPHRCWYPRDPDDPSNGLNFGPSLYRSRQPPAPNLLLLTAERKPLDSHAEG